MLTIRQVTEMRRLYAAGHKRSALAALYGVHVATVWKFTAPPPDQRGRPRPSPSRDAVLRGMLAGQPLDEIAQQLGIKPSTARVQAWKLRRLGELPPIETPVAPEPVAPAADHVRPPRRSAAGASINTTAA